MAEPTKKFGSGCSQKKTLLRAAPALQHYLTIYTVPILSFNFNFPNKLHNTG